MNYSNKTKKNVTARQQVITDKINATRMLVIESELELQFMRHAKEQNIATDAMIPGGIDKYIENTEAFYNFNLEKLNFLKSVRDENIKKVALKDAEKAIKSTPSRILVSRVDLP